jgi:hypothetical protein
MEAQANGPRKLHMHSLQSVAHGAASHMDRGMFTRTLVCRNAIPAGVIPMGIAPQSDLLLWTLDFGYPVETK